MSLWYQSIVGLASVLFFVFSDYTITRWAELLKVDGIWTWRLIIVMVLVPLGMICFGLLGARIGLATVSAYVNAGIVSGGVLIGLSLRGEMLTAHQKVGLVLALVAIVLLSKRGLPFSGG